MKTPPPPPRLLVGLPYASDGPLTETARALGASVLLSAGGLWRDGTAGGHHKRGFRIPEAAWGCRSVSLDSAGFTAMLAGGYRWSVSEYVEAVVTATSSKNPGAPFPFAWWSAMDYCCEQQVAGNREEVRRRVDLTVRTYGELLRELNQWREDGAFGLDVPDPMPVLQGRKPEDYLRCARELAEVIDELDPCLCPYGGQDCQAHAHRRRTGLPTLVGLGSVCRRHLRGEEGLLALLPALDAGLPPHVRLHLFGVKGAALLALRPWWHRIASADSMAWDTAAREDARAAYRREGVNPKNTVARRATFLRSWYETQQAGLRRAPAARVISPHPRVRKSSAPAQMNLFP